jgi:hypothetical protein
MRFSAARPEGRRRGIVVSRLPLHKRRAALPLRFYTAQAGSSPRNIACAIKDVH